jgi:hypothetical protein
MDQSPVAGRPRERLPPAETFFKREIKVVRLYPRLGQAVLQPRFYFGTQKYRSAFRQFDR